jgi:Ca-activated chloride channel family protein
MMVLEEFHFIRPSWLLLLPVVLLLWWLERKANDSLRGWRGLIDPRLLGALTVGETTNNRWRGIGLLVAWLLGVIAVAGPTWRPEPSPFADDPVPVMIVLKAGESMNATDLIPNRMERARLKVADFANERRGLPLGLVAYSGSAHLVLPPTRDTSVVATMAAEISPEIMPKSGDDLAASLMLAEKTLGESRGSIVVVADTAGSDNLDALAEFHKQSRSPVCVLAIARSDTPELDALNKAATSLGASVTIMTPDSADIDSLVRRTAKAPVAVSSAGDGTRWAEAGWWLVPALAAVVLVSFRREHQVSLDGDAS